MIDRVISAKTHPAEYLLHKYWARKPHNVISSIVETFTEPGDLVIDPCCGSGVSLKEAESLGRYAIGFDVNPIACLITQVLIDPPKPKDFEAAVLPLIDFAEAEYGHSYKYNGKVVKYCRHEQIVRCPSCNSVISHKDLPSNNKKKCPKCGATIRYNLNHLIGTSITGVVLEGNSDIVTDSDICVEQEHASSIMYGNASFASFNQSLVENRRILAYDGMTASSFFTKRNFSLICCLEELIDEIKDERVRNAARLMVSASIAQCSRLIAFRNNLTSGGPAWSVPGFWVPAIHLETNPFIHLRARYKKFVKGLIALDKQNPGDYASVRCIEASIGLRELRENGKTAKLVFFDPPYGDSVPYLEFSAIWNSFLKASINLDDDISVSDRMPKEKAWHAYSKGLIDILDNVAALLEGDGRLVITFNNNDSRAWTALLTALQSNGFRCETSIYQIPAVVSSKAQMSINGSYISDLYSVFYQDPAGSVLDNTEPVREYLVKCAAFRGGRISKGMGMRLAMEAWLLNNIDAALLSTVDDLIKEIFRADGDWLVLREHNEETGETPFARRVQELAIEVLANGRIPWMELYEAVANGISEYGMPDMHEVKAALASSVEFAGKDCIPKQMSLF